ncbi:MAG: hypothetical protein AAGN46_07900 [Acidobacteriota bacterium]
MLDAGALLAATTNQHPNLSRGQSSVGRYDTDGPATIDLFNGNLMFEVPLGLPYPLNAELDYRFALRYNSHIWDFAEDGRGELIALSNAGVGFEFGFGRLKPPAAGQTQWTYVASDGRESRFYADLHWDTPDTSDPSGSFHYTRDGSFLRLQVVGSSSAWVEFPDGTRHQFAPVSGVWRPHRIETADGLHYVDLSYVGSTWTAVDSIGRSQVASFVADPARPGAQLLDTLELAAFGGTRATYQFDYAQIDFSRACSDPRADQQTASVLTSVVDPVGFERRFTYHLGAADCLDGGRMATGTNGTGGIVAFDYGAYSFPTPACEGQAPTHLTSVSGVVEREHRHPQGQVIGTWTYQPSHVMAGCAADERRTAVQTPLGDRQIYYFGAGGDGASAGASADYALPISDSDVDADLSTAGLRVAVASRIWDCAMGGGSCQLVRSTWEGWRQDERCANGSGNCFDTNRRLELKRTVFHDDEDRFKQQQFSQYDGLGNYRRTITTSDFGIADTTTTVRWSNSEAGIYQSALGLTGEKAGFVVPSTGQPWVLDDASFATITDEDGRTLRRDLCDDAFGRRLMERRHAGTLSPNDVVKVHLWAAGHQVGEGFYGGATQDLPTTADLCSLQLPSTPVAWKESSWMHGVRATSRWLEPDGTPMAHLDLDRDIDFNTGLVKKSRDVSGLETTLLYDAVGRLTSNRPSVGEGAWSEIRYLEPRQDLLGGWAGPRATFFRYPNGSSAGTPLSQRIEQRDVFGHRFIDREWIDADNAVQRVFAYDALGNLTNSSTPHAPGTAHSWHQWLDFDPFGRPRLERPADGAAHDKTHEFFGVRRSLHTESVKRAYDTVGGGCYEHPATTEILYDGSGREWIYRFERLQPQPVELVERERRYQPDGSPRFDETRRFVGASEEVSRREWTFDGLGRAIEVAHKGGTTGGLRLLATSTFSDHDARGLHRRETTVGDLYPLPGVSVRRTYDAAGRLLIVSDADDPSRLWKEYEYATVNGAPANGASADRKLGKLVRAVRHNYSSSWASSAHHAVEDIYSYRGIDGLRSSKRTSLVTVASSSLEMQLTRGFETSMVYDALGRVVELTYPTSLQPSTGEPSEVRRVTYRYDWLGRQTAIGGSYGNTTEDWIDSIVWSEVGIPSAVIHDNDVKDLYTDDPSGMTRPVRIRTEFDGVLYSDTGSMAYDGRDELCGYGQRSLVMSADELGARFDPPPPCAVARSYDPFGLWNGELDDPGCLFDTGPQTLVLHDASDRPFGVVDLSARKKISTLDGPEWVRDPANYTHTWTLFGLDGRYLRRVEDHYQGTWRETIDRVHGLSRVVGTARVEAHQPGYVDRSHKHPMMTQHTDWRGWLRNPQN